MVLFFQSHTMFKLYVDGLPYFYRQIFKTSTNWYIPNASIVLLQKKLRLSWLRAAKFFSMQIIEFPSATQRQAFTSPSMKYM